MASSLAPPFPTEESPSATLVAIGPWDRGEFASLGKRLSGESRWTTAPDCASACRWLRTTSEIPAALLLAQPLARTYSQAEIESLRQLAPLAHIVVIAGTWCEGELRTGQPLLGTSRIYWYECEHWWRAWCEGRVGWSAGLDGPFVAGERPSCLQLKGLAAVHTSTCATFAALATSLTPHGLECCWVRDLADIPSRITVGIWDGGQLDPGEFARLEAFATRIKHAGGSLVVLLDFPRKEHFARLQELGCSGLLGKPYRVGDLVALIAAYC